MSVERRLGSAPPRPLPRVLPEARWRAAVGSRDTWIARNEAWVIPALVLILFLSLSAWLIFDRELRGDDSVIRLLSAHLVTHGEERRLASIGFLLPPIPTLVLIPFAAIKPLFTSFYAVGIVSSVFMALASFHIWRSCALLGFGWQMRIAFTALFILNPVVVAMAMVSVSEPIAYAFLAGGAYRLLKYNRDGQLSDVVFAGTWLGLATVTRYELMIVALVAAALVLIRSVWQEPAPRWPDDFTRASRGFGVVLAFLAAALYPMLLWIVASWLIKDHGLWFLYGDQGLLTLAPEKDALGAIGGIRLASWLTMIAFPTAIIAGLGALGVGILRRSVMGAGLGLLVITVPATQAVLLAAGFGVEVIRPYTLVIPLSFPAMLYIFIAFPRPNRWQHVVRPVAAGMLLVLLAFGALIGAITLGESGRTEVEATAWDALRGERVPDRALAEGKAVGETIEQLVPDGERVLLDYVGSGFAVRYGLEGDTVFDYTHSGYADAVEEPWEFADWVLLPNPVGADEFNAIHQANPNIYPELNGRAVKVLDFPGTGPDWKLFRLKRGPPEQ